MSIRSAAKAIVLHDGKVLLNKCKDQTNGDYYALPGGGQNPYETLHEAIVRECLEETGYTVIPVSFAALYDEICDDEMLRERYPEYAHKVYHIFLCVLSDEARCEPTEVDSMQTDCEWVSMDEMENRNILPKVVAAHLRELAEGKGPMFLGSDHIAIPHG